VGRTRCTAKPTGNDDEAGMLNQETRKAGKYRDRIYGINRSLFVNLGSAYAKATARQVTLIKRDIVFDLI
jgi:hypothetical protein